ncbi:hypothetical protein EVAR_23646_1 [Eumeta japonica]|uniref:Uncharacterized protein n=1 Tax=Eumeta variegata TaxID=151549 RepID=A0A4C1VIU2_EUMVA|nr:hypothetical protein EVAR_23646_1 [Eumeta japonica]
MTCRAPAVRENKAAAASWEPAAPGREFDSPANHRAERPSRGVRNALAHVPARIPTLDKSRDDVMINIDGDFVRNSLPQEMKSLGCGPSHRHICDPNKSKLITATHAAIAQPSASTPSHRRRQLDPKRGRGPAVGPGRAPWVPALGDCQQHQPNSRPAPSEPNSKRQQPRNTNDAARAARKTNKGHT